MAPEDLGSMGYSGPSGMYIPNQVQTQAYSTLGQPLEFYRTWNASWYQPWNFFGSLSSINKTDLVPCNYSGGVLASDAAMKRHVHFTNDLDGVINTSVPWARLCISGEEKRLDEQKTYIKLLIRIALYFLESNG